MYIVEMTEKNFEDAADCFVQAWKSAYAQFYPEDYVEAFNQEKVISFFKKDQAVDRLTFIASDKGSIIGFITIDKGKCEIPRLYIAPDKQRQGMGTKLIEFGLKQLSSVNRVYVSLIAANAASVNFFEKVGFDFTGEQRSLKNGQLELRYVFKKKK